MLLSDKELKRRIIFDENAIELWRSRNWEKISDSILIYPYKEEQLGACSYDLCVGEEYISLRDPHTVRRLRKGEIINIDPGETVLILTKEYIGLPKNVMAMVVPRARWIFEGTSLNATKVDATWHGKLLVGFTNLAKYPIFLRYGEPFCTCYFIKCTDVENPLTKKDVPFLGRTSIDPIHFIHARPSRLKEPSEVTRDHLNEVVEAFGYPFDIIRGAIDRSRIELEEYIEKEFAPHLIEQTTLLVKEKAYDQLIKILTVFVGLIGAFISAIIYLLYLLHFG